MDRLLKPEAGGWLTGQEIEARVRNGEIVIDPFFSVQLNPNSYNYRLDKTLKCIKNEIIDLKSPDDYEEIDLSDSGTTLYPGNCYLGCTVERIGSSYFASLITGRSSVGRKFVTNHITAGLIDVGFIGKLTLEITVVKPTVFYPNILIGQIYWFTMVGSIAGYDGRYQRQREPTLSRLHMDFGDGR